jgi:hypothetical protein
LVQSHVFSSISEWFLSALNCQAVNLSAHSRIVLMLSFSAALCQAVSPRWSLNITIFVRVYECFPDFTLSSKNPIIPAISPTIASRSHFVKPNSIHCNLSHSTVHCNLSHSTFHRVFLHKTSKLLSISKALPKVHSERL